MPSHPLFYFVLAASIMSISWWVYVMLRTQINTRFLALQLGKLLAANNRDRAMKLLAVAGTVPVGLVFKETFAALDGLGADDDAWVLQQRVERAFDQASAREAKKLRSKGWLPLVLAGLSLLAIPGLARAEPETWIWAVALVPGVCAGLGWLKLRVAIGSWRPAFEGLRPALIEDAIARRPEPGER